MSGRGPNAARLAALGLVEAVLGRRCMLDDAMGRDATLPALPPSDRAFARRIVATVLRRLGQIDAALEVFVRRPLPARAGTVRSALRIGAAQILFIGTPAHAAVNSTVELLTGGDGAYRKLANAVLRRIAERRAEILAAQDAGRLNLPDWLWTSWLAAYGERVTRAIGEVASEDPPLDFTVKSDPEGWAERLGGRVLPTGTVRRPQSAVVPDLPGFREGAWWVQDAAAALPVRLLGPVAGQTVIDLCAAPGGKTAQLAAAGAKVIAVDRSAGRLRRLEANLNRLGLNARLVEADALEWRPERRVRHILLDAPCSATGTLRRHPEVRWLKTADDVARMSALQDRLLAAAVDMLEPGGTLVYCSCSLQPEEGEQRVGRLLAQGLPVRRDPIRPEEVAGFSELISPEKDLRTLPCHLAPQGGMDGFFAARLNRVS